MSVSLDSKDASGTLLSCSKQGDKKKKGLGIEMWSYLYMGAGGFSTKRGVGILLNKRWKRKIIKTEYVSERMITTTSKCDQRKIELTRVHFLHSAHADMHFEKMHKNIETPCNNKKHTGIISCDFKAQLGPGKDSVCDHVGKLTYNGRTKQTRDVDEAVVNDSAHGGSQYNIQRKTPEKTLHLQIHEWERETAGLCET